MSGPGIRAKAGIDCSAVSAGPTVEAMDPGFRRGDGLRGRALLTTVASRTTAR
jgi:hypothetical protein